MIASGSGDGRIRLWDSVTGACTASLGDVGGPQDGVTSVVLKQASGGVVGVTVLLCWRLVVVMPVVVMLVVVLVLVVVMFGDLISLGIET